MGRSFYSEMTILEDTYTKALQIDAASIKRYLLNNLNHPFFVVGSGGSFCVCETISLFIESLGGYAKAVTPYELIYSCDTLSRANVILYSASGGNKDILGVYEYCKKSGAKSTYIICLKEESKLQVLAREKYNDLNCFVSELPNGRDGFLAFHSTLYILTILQSLYSKLYGTDIYQWSNDVFSMDASFVSNVTHFMALGSGWTLPIVIDFESKCTEAALSQVLYSDIRNFAHGRHHWLAKHPDTVVLAFTSSDTIDLVSKMLKIIPEKVKRQVLLSNYKGIACTIELFIKMCVIVGELGKDTGIDPGKPGVPDFGSKLYHLNFKFPNNWYSSNRDIISRMISRKSIENEESSNTIVAEAAKDYIEKLSFGAFKGLVIDYDNTVIRSNNTQDPTYHKILSFLEKYVERGIVVCFSTGRGKSIRDHLLQFFDKTTWSKIYISYYNGSLTQSLDKELPDCENNIPELLLNVSNDIKQVPLFSSIKSDDRNYQITFTCDNKPILNRLFFYINRRIINGVFDGIKAEITDHSIDVSLLRVSKKNSVVFVQKICNGSVLCIGDAGSETGNDYDLLNTEYSLSVSSVSLSLDNCWNIASEGLTGPEATFEYLSNIKVLKKGLVIKKEYLRY